MRFSWYLILDLFVTMIRLFLASRVLLVHVIHIQVGPCCLDERRTGGGGAVGMQL